MSASFNRAATINTIPTIVLLDIIFYFFYAAQRAARLMIYVAKELPNPFAGKFLGYSAGLCDE
jgi:hypothetical protein